MVLPCCSLQNYAAWCYIGQGFVEKYVLRTVEQIVDVTESLVMEEKWRSSGSFPERIVEQIVERPVPQNFGRDCRVATFEQVQKRIVELRGCTQSTDYGVYGYLCPSVLDRDFPQEESSCLTVRTLHVGTV